MKSTAIGWWIWHLIYGLPWRYVRARKLGGSRRRSWRVAWAVTRVALRMGARMW